MPRLDEIGDDLVRALADHYGPAPHPGPAEASSLFERLARVSLDLVATPKVAAAAWEALRDGGMLVPATLAGANPLEIDDILKQARVAMAIKSIRPLQNLARWMVGRGLDVEGDKIGDLSTDAIRDDWRAINGIGLASADALLLLGLRRISYPVDRATYRVLVRHGWIDVTTEYDEARMVVERLARSTQPDEDHKDETGQGEATIAPLLAEMGDWFERIGREFCKPSQARCERCPLQPWLPTDGPVEVE